MTSSHTDTAHSVADLAAVHRDLLWLLSRMGPCERHPLHRALTAYYTDGIDHDRVRDTLEELIERDFVATHTTTYRLTESARRALSARQAWQASAPTRGGPE